MTALRQELDRYFRLRRSLGHDLAEAARLLPRFVEYLELTGAEFVTIDAALAWSQAPDAAPGTTVWPRRMMAVRGFARHLAGIDSRTEVPPVGMIPFRQRWRPPFIYAEADIIALMSEARGSIPSPFRATTFETLIGLLAVTGLRVGEALRLDRGDLDCFEGVLAVRRSKFGKSRQVPLTSSALNALREYARQRDLHERHLASPSFFISGRGTRLIYPNVLEMFRRLCDAAAVGAGSPMRPRIHDLRHSFAVHTLVGWYRDGGDVQSRLPWLSTYLGHRDPCSTYWYLSAAPELLGHAMKRLEAVPGVLP
ncbi:MAG: tyrosine-type recombinase/integrase [Candidatus Dormibacteria bacterium]